MINPACTTYYNDYTIRAPNAMDGCTRNALES